MSVVYVHVGLPKTGTTHVQDRLWRNRDHALARAGLLYPGNRIDDHFHAAAHLQPERYLDWADPAHAGVWPSMVAQMRAWHGSSLVSHELFANAGPEHIRRLVADLSFADEVHAVLTVRDLARQVPSVWQENVKNQRQAALDEFVESIADDHAGPGQEPFWEFQDYRRITADWSEVVGPERVHIVTVPAPGTASDGDGLWERFVRALGMDPADLPAEVPSSNKSLSATQTELLRRLNGRLQPEDIEWRRYERLVKGVLIGDYLFATRDGRPEGLTGPQAAWAARKSEEMVAELVRRGHPVAGTVQDLRVTATAGDESAAVTDGDIVEAALDVIALWAKTGPVPDRSPALTTRAADLVRRVRRRLMR
ncbi:sulfotransferase family protein [Gordonia sp. PS3]|uniref:sulfotransferase family protein n=1 Tax=Gordonia sp. PS3 TaxID=3248841 RepID=UPI0035C1B16E